MAARGRYNPHTSTCRTTSFCAFLVASNMFSFRPCSTHIGMRAPFSSVIPTIICAFPTRTRWSHSQLHLALIRVRVLGRWSRGVALGKGEIRVVHSASESAHGTTVRMIIRPCFATTSPCAHLRSLEGSARASSVPLKCLLCLLSCQKQPTSLFAHDFCC